MLTMTNLLSSRSLPPQLPPRVPQLALMEMPSWEMGPQQYTTMGQRLLVLSLSSTMAVL